MFVLKLLGVLAFLAAVVLGMVRFNQHCQEKFSYRFFTVISFIACAAAVGLIELGRSLRAGAAAAPEGDVLNGILLIILGAALAMGLAFYNFKKTDLAYGAGGTILQVSIFSVLAYVGFAILILGLVVSFIGAALLGRGGEPVTGHVRESSFRVPRW
jgi:hypothetical protein